MTNNEMNIALAKAIGWQQVDIQQDPFGVYVRTRRTWGWQLREWSRFDYKDPTVIWPIAEKYDHFPFKTGIDRGLWCTTFDGQSHETPELAVALAVIGGAA